MTQTIPLTQQQRALIQQKERALTVAEHQLQTAQTDLSNFYAQVLAAHVLKVERPAGNPDVRLTEEGLLFDVPEAPPPSQDVGEGAES